MHSQFLNDPADCLWLWSVHLGKRQDMRPGVAFNSFVLYGNEAAPDKVELYASADPLLTDTPHTVNFLGA